MAILKGSISDNTGKPIADVSIQVYLADTTTPASLYSDKAMQVGMTNPMTTETDGSFMCYLAAGWYDLVPTKSGVTFDTTDFEDEFAPMSLASEIPNVPAGDIAATDVQAAINELDSEKVGTATADTISAAHTFTGAVIFNGSPLFNKTGLSGDAAIFKKTDAALRIQLEGDGTNPKKFIEISGGKFMLKDHAGTTTIFELTNAGALTIPNVLDSKTNPFLASLSSSLTGLTSGVLTKLPCNAEEWDTDGVYDNATNYRYQPDVPGKFILSGMVGVSPVASNSLQLFEARLYKNGLFKRTLFYLGVSFTAGIGCSQAFAVQVDANGSSDYFEIFVSTTVSASTWTINAGSHWQGNRVGK